MRIYFQALAPFVAGLAPAATGFGVWLGFGAASAAFAASALAGAAAFGGLARMQMAASARALDEAVAGAAASCYADPFAAPALERLRAALKGRETALLADIEARAADSKRRKREADIEAQGYIDAHEKFMKTFTAALKALAEGDLSVRLETPYSRDYEPLRHCFNQSLDRLNQAFHAAATGVKGLSGAVESIAGSMGDLAGRTGRQAANVEEASATLRSILTALGQTAAEAQSAASAVSGARGRAETGAEVVARAVEAMRRIRASAGDIEKIIAVIDAIAFQTNLLALNAGVEAARAGESGKGFAIVASEVRGLALRSAEAAKEIKGLISASSAQVREGVELVGRTGEVLSDIVGLVGDANKTVAAIAAGTAEQKTMLDAVDEAMRQLDAFTQQNAAMLESTDSASRSASDEAAEIAETIARFRLRCAAVEKRAA